MPPRRDAERLQDMLDAAAELAGFLEDLDFDAFMAKAMVRKAALWQLAVIGEAAAHVSIPFRAGHPDIEWQDVADFRNFIIHEYFGIDWSIVWHVAHREVPDLFVRTQAILGLLSG